MTDKKIRFLLTKSIMDAHDRGMTYVARKLEEAGMEVILTIYGAVDEIANTAIQEDVDAIGVTFHSGGQIYCGQRMLELLKAQERNDILVVFGGAIPPRDEADLLKMGINKVFTPGASSEEFVSYIENSAPQSH